jgi:DNA-binding LacI/PurR family transcriptional regulator
VSDKEHGVVTIADVAKAAGVSSSTVSYVLSGKRPISPNTRERVLRSIQSLGYHPHAGARALASHKTNVLALVAPLRADIVVPVIMQFATAIVTEARSHDHDVLLLTQDEGPEGIARVTSSAMVDALILMDVEQDDPRIPQLAEQRQPAVLIGLPAVPMGLSCVDLDFEAAARCAVDHLADHGHRRIAMVGQPAAVYERGTSHALRFQRGFTEGLAAHGAQGISEPCEQTYTGVSECLDRILQQLPGVTALVVHNEPTLGPVLDQLRARGRRVPDDVSVVTLCPSGDALSHPVRLTSIDIPAAEVGAIAVQMVMQRMQHDGEPEIRLVAPRLTERDSCAAPPA